MAKNQTKEAKAFFFLSTSSHQDPSSSALITDSRDPGRTHKIKITQNQKKLKALLALHTCFCCARIGKEVRAHNTTWLFFLCRKKMEDPVPPLFPEAPFIPGKYEVPTGVGESR